MSREKSKPHVMSNFAECAYYCYKEKSYGKGKRREKEKKNFVVTSSGTLFCRLRKKETERESGEEEASKWDQLID